MHSGWLRAQPPFSAECRTHNLHPLLSGELQYALPTTTKSVMSHENISRAPARCKQPAPGMLDMLPRIYVQRIHMIQSACHKQRPCSAHLHRNISKLGRYVAPQRDAKAELLCRQGRPIAAGGPVAAHLEAGPKRKRALQAVVDRTNLEAQRRRSSWSPRCARR